MVVMKIGMVVVSRNCLLVIVMSMTQVVLLEVAEMSYLEFPHEVKMNPVKSLARATTLKRIETAIVTVQM